MKVKVIIPSILFCLLFNIVSGQNITQTIKGKVIDKVTQIPLPGATIAIIGTNPLIGASTDANGEFVIKNVSVGRYNIKVNFIGYEPMIINEVLVGSGKEVFLTAEVKESLVNMKEVVIRVNKEDPLNSMTTVSARQLNVEESSRYAGGFDDPARLASSFAGVSSNLGNNGIVIRGNSPKGLLWQMEGVEISNPSHFANITSFGAGAITALSSQMLANSDFFTGAFPSEYGNALSGVFDIKLRTGNNEKRENTFQAGLVGIDLSSEGPLNKNKKSSYLFNYRYSTFALLAPILPPEMGKLKYQDLSFKINLPTKKSGVFSFWGISALDYQGRDAVKDSSSWKSDIDKQKYSTNLFMYAIGINHKIIIGSNTYISSTFSPTGYGLSLNQKSYNENNMIVPTNKIDNYIWKYTFTSFINHKFNSKHSNKTGIILNRLQYNLNIQKADSNQTSLLTYVDDHGSSYLLQAYSQSKYNFTNNLVLNIGVHSQIFTLNNRFSIEPRIGLSWIFLPHQVLGISYGLHSQLEMLHLNLLCQHQIFWANHLLL